MLRIFNTLSRKKENFKPLKPRRVGLYTCGPTVYNYAHTGNLRTYIFEDLLQRTLEYNDYKVKRVMNITDVGHLTSDADTGEDKIEKEAQKENRSVWEIAQFYTDAFLQDIQDLNIRMPKILVPATKAVKEQIKIIKKLLAKDLAYETNKAIYFFVPRFKNYTKLSRQPLSEKITGAREEVITDPEKKHPADFVLWFKLVDHFKNHIMRWSSPWGEGFPGWHIECSAISTKYLGQPFDIHTGGVDHINVHHTNEIAQSEGAYGKPLAKYWLHGEFLLIDQSRMGKSVGNFLTLADLKKEGFDPLAYRYLILTSHYRSQLNFSWDSLRAAQNAYQNLKNKLSILKNSDANIGGVKTAAKNSAELKKWLREFESAINDDLNSPQALAALQSLIGKAISLMKKQRLSRPLLTWTLKTIAKMDQVLSLKLDQIPKIPSEVAQLLKERELFRLNKQFAQSDALRKKIEALGYQVEDTPAGPLIHKSG